MLSSAGLVLAVLVLACLSVAFYCRRSLLRQARGLELHAHADGTVHEHHRGDVPHAHPTFSERYDMTLARILRETSRTQS